jgi:hypothetical protein
MRFHINSTFAFSPSLLWGRDFERRSLEKRVRGPSLVLRCQTRTPFSGEFKDGDNITVDALKRDVKSLEFIKKDI